MLTSAIVEKGKRSDELFVLTNPLKRTNSANGFPSTSSRRSRTNSLASPSSRAASSSRINTSASIVTRSELKKNDVAERACFSPVSVASRQYAVK